MSTRRSAGLIDMPDIPVVVEKGIRGWNWFDPTEPGYNQRKKVGESFPGPDRKPWRILNYGI
jgi:hypothetical protein